MKVLIQGYRAHDGTFLPSCMDGDVVEDGPRIIRRRYDSTSSPTTDEWWAGILSLPIRAALESGARPERPVYTGKPRGRKKRDVAL